MVEVRIIITKSKSKYHDLALQFVYNQEIVDVCRVLKDELGWKDFGFNGETKTWDFSLGVLNKVMARFPEAIIDEQASIEIVSRQQSILEEESKLKKARSKVEIESLPLKEYQKIGVSFLAHMDNCILADEPGLGKTLQAIGAIVYLNLKQVLIVCPASLKSNWQNEIYKWTKMKSTIIKNEIVDGINIINYEMLDKISHDFKWEVIVADESHALKNRKAKRTKAFADIAKSANRVWLLSGTPVLNRPIELVSQLEILNRIDRFGGYWKFQLRYCNGHVNNWGHWDFTGSSNLEELKEKLETIMIRRSKDDVLGELPEKTVSTTLLDIPDIEGYNKFKDNLREEINNSKAEIKDIYRQLSGMTDIEKASYLTGLRKNKHYQTLISTALSSIEKIKQEVVRQKLLVINDILEPLIANRIKTVVFTTHKSTAFLLNSSFPNSVIITGDTPVAQRQQIVDEFQNNKDILFFFGTMRTIGTGITLTEATNAIFIELDWTPSIHRQAEDRIHRIGSMYPVTIKYLVMKDTIEEDIIDLLMQKDNVIQGITGDNMLVKLLSRRLLSA